MVYLYLIQRDWSSSVRCDECGHMTYEVFITVKSVYSVTLTTEVL